MQHVIHEYRDSTHPSADSRPHNVFAPSPRKSGVCTKERIMYSAYKNIKIDHQELIDLLRELSILFKSVPLDAGGNQATDATADNTKALATAAKQTPPESSTEVVPTKDLCIWKDMPKALELCARLTERLDQHFQHERHVIYTGMLLGLPVKQMALWVMRREYEHGQIAELAKGLHQIVSIIRPPVERKWAKEIEELFERMRSLCLQHAVEEDSKMDTIIRNNSNIAKKIATLEAEFKRRTRVSDYAVNNNPAPLPASQGLAASGAPEQG